MGNNLAWVSARMPWFLNLANFLQRNWSGTTPIFKFLCSMVYLLPVISRTQTRTVG